MAYKITYSPETAYLYPQGKKEKRNITGKWITAAFLIAGLLWIRLNGIADFLIPGNPEVTKEAASVFMEDLQEGVRVHDAVTTFCKTILNDGMY